MTASNKKEPALLIFFTSALSLTFFAIDKYINHELYNIIHNNIDEYYYDISNTKVIKKEEYENINGDIIISSREFLMHCSNVKNKQCVNNHSH